MEADVSVTVVTHNRPAMLDELIHAELAQTVQPREIVVVDNGSDSQTPQVVARYGGRVRYKRVSGMPRDLSRNLSIELATSCWVSPIDDDDVHDKSFCEAALEAMEDHRVTMIGCDYRGFDESGPFVRTRFQQFPKGYWDGFPKPDPGSDWSFVDRFPMDRLVKRNPFEPGQMIVRKDLLMQIGAYDPEFTLPIGVQFELNSRLLSSARLAIIWRPLLHYRRHAGNVTAREWRNRYNKLKTFEYIRDKDAHGSADLSRALEQDIPRRRAALFDQAIAFKEFSFLPELAAALDQQQANLWRRSAMILTKLPVPAANLASAVIRKGLRVSRFRETLDYV